jgi:endoglucanase
LIEGSSFMRIDDKHFIFTTFGVSGREEQVRERIEQHAAARVDEVIHDTTGSLICVKRGRGPHRLMISAHMDSIGFIVTHIDERGFLRFSEVGHQIDVYLLGRRVIFENGQIGVIGIEKLEAKGKLDREKMFIDIGARNRSEAIRRVSPGDMCAVYAPCALNDRVITGGWLDDRIGCFVLLEVLSSLKRSPHHVYFVFSSQEEVGLRGATTTAYRMEPDVGIAVDVTIASDLPEGEHMGSSVLGGGAAIKFMDQGIIVPRRLALHIEELAEKKGIAHQRDVIRRGGTDAHAIQLSRGGVLTGGISIPARYLHSSGEMCALEDVKACIDLVRTLCTSPLPLQ